MISVSARGLVSTEILYIYNKSCFEKILLLKFCAMAACTMKEIQANTKGKGSQSLSRLRGCELTENI